ncbi:metallophosphoesterase [Granulosicoccus sp.]|nr:metallophosphoesterase [Granulosicoccus sp.]MDB4222557.1 metallophosphoesterase [Granulosicoccus sp.]
MVQLGDVHFKSIDDPALVRAKKIGVAVAQEVTAETGSIILIYVGDLAFSGTEEQFELADLFVNEVKEQIVESISVTCKIIEVCVPGNHDCDFSGNQNTRDQSLGAVDENTIADSVFLGRLISPLHGYFKFVAKVFEPMCSNSDDNPFYSFVDVVDSEKTIRLHLLNTAWMSSKSEMPGSIFFPVLKIPTNRHDYDFGVAVMHHPLNWFRQPDTMRELKGRLNKIASIVLNGHEHVAEASKEETLFSSPKNDSDENETIYINGGVIQEDSESELCTFNTLTFDLVTLDLKIKSFGIQSKEEACYFKCQNDVKLKIKDVNTTIGDTGVVLKEGMQQYLDDPGAPVTHPDRDPRTPITLKELFVTPDLWEYSGKQNQNQQNQVNAENVISEIVNSEKTLIEGLEKSGKTCLLKIVFKEFTELGRLPLFIDGAKAPRSASGLRDYLRKIVRETYANCDPDFYEQLPNRNKAIIIDNSNEMQLKENEYDAYIQFLERHFGTIVVGAEELAYQQDSSSEFLSGFKIAGCRHLRLLGLGETLRKRFVVNWLELADETRENIKQEEVERICSLLNIVIRTQLIPTYPIFILLLLQQSDIRNASVQGGSFGKLFDGVVTAILHKSSYERIDIQAKYNYLSAFAMELYERSAKDTTVVGMDEWHTRYWNNVDIDGIRFSALCSDLVSLGILEQRDGHILFRYDYYYCFFVANSISRNLHKAEATDLVSNLTNNLHHKLSADIVLFLVHLTGNPVVIEKMIDTCDSLFAESSKLRLDEEFLQLRAVGDAVDKIEIRDDPVSNAEIERAKRDSIVDNRLPPNKSDVVSPPSPENDRENYLFQLHAATKSIQILGQALRNISGSAEKAIKERAITSIVDLSRRILGEVFLSYSNENIEYLVHVFMESHKENNPSIMPAALKKQVLRHIYGQGQLVCFAMIRILSHSIGSENLSNTVERLLSNEIPINRLLLANYKLEVKKQNQQFPRQVIISTHKQLSDNEFNVGILRFLVAHHMYLFDIPMQDKQALASNLNIKLLARDVTGRHKQLTSSK